MCGRFALTTPPDVIAKWYELMHRLEFSPRYNIAPTQSVVMVKHDKKGKREAAEARWGLVPFWAKDMSIGSRLINARADSAASKPSFRQAMQKRRCLIPASGFYEWKKIGSKKQPYYISRDDGNPITFAGLWEYWKDPEAGADDEGIQSCTILTTDANAALRELHDRMPVVLGPKDWDKWLDFEGADAEAVHKLLKPAPVKGWRIYPVSRSVNSPANDNASLIEPLEAVDSDADEAVVPPRKKKSRSKSKKSGSSSGGLFEM